MSLVEPIAAHVDPPRLRMTIDEFLAIPDDGMDRMLIDGEVWETGMTVRNRFHSRIESRIAHSLVEWLMGQPIPRGQIHSGDAGFRLGPGHTTVGIDVAYASAELVARTPDDALIYEGPPVLAVEILSPSDQRRATIAKVRKYLEVGTVVWEVEPEYRLVRVHRPGVMLESFNASQELVGDPYLPGFRVAVAAFFAA